VTTEANTESGAIYDLGYRSYDGPRLGRGYAFRSLMVQSLRAAFGLGRSARMRIVPFTLLGFSTIPALIGVAVAAASGNAFQLMTHEQSFEQTHWIFALFCAAQAPELVASDRQYNVLPLYFSRALRRGDYVLAKLLALTGALLVISLAPQLTLFVGRSFVNANPWSMFQRDAHLLLPIFGSAIIIALLFASFGLLIASVTRRRALATAAIVGTLMLTAAASNTLVRMSQGTLRQTIVVSPIEVSKGVTHALFRKAPPPRSALGRANMPGYFYVITALTFAGAFASLTSLRYSRLRT
jgi:ABC-2 type transport system permease protein